LSSCVQQFKDRRRGLHLTDWEIRGEDGSDQDRLVATRFPQMAPIFVQLRPLPSQATLGPGPQLHFNTAAPIAANAAAADNSRRCVHPGPVAPQIWVSGTWKLASPRLAWCRVTAAAA
ncbi:hypothetical protein RRG08_057612, partial [Elysia crispata]